MTSHAGVTTLVIIGAPLVITDHGKMRMSQRGVRESDLYIVLYHGTEIGRDRIMLMRRDAARLIRKIKKEIAKIERLTPGNERRRAAWTELKKQIAKIERLKDKVIVVEDGCLVTTYHQAGPARPSGKRTRRRRRG